MTVQYHYDDLGRLVRVQYPNSAQDVHYFYDEVEAANPHAIGKLTRITDQSGTTQYRYDHRGNLTAYIRTLAGQTYSTLYAYNLANKLTQITYPDGRVVNYQRGDALGRVDQVTTLKNGSAVQTVVSNVAYLPFGPVTSFDYGNGLTRQVPYDLDYRIDQISVVGASTALSLDFSYDRFNNIVGIANGLNPQQSETFAYDDLHRLQHAYGQYGNTNHIRYEYDMVGNRTLRGLSLGGVEHTLETYSYDPASNKLNDVTRIINGTPSVRSLSYSAAGNLEAETTYDGNSRSLFYDDNNRMIELAENGLNQGEYQHNALGQRVSKTVNGVTTHFLYGPEGELLAEADSNGNLTRQYLYLNGQMIAVVDVME